MALEDKISKPKRNWQELCPTKEDAINYYNEHYHSKTPAQLRKESTLSRRFYDFLKERKWTDITAKEGRSDWSFIKTEEDAIKHRDENFPGNTSTQLKRSKEGKKFHAALQAKGFLSILDKEVVDWGNIQNKEDAQKYYDEKLAGLTSGQVQVIDSKFWQFVHRKNWLDILPKQIVHKDWSFIKTKDDAIKYINEHFPGKTANQIKKDEEGRFLYAFLRRQDWLDITAKRRTEPTKDWSFIKTKEDAEKYLNEHHFQGLTPGQIARKDMGFYNKVRNKGWDGIFSKGRELIDWSFIKTKEDAIKYRDEYFFGMTSHQVEKDEKGSKFCYFLRGRGKEWVEILPKVENTWAHIQNKEDARKYYNEHFPGKNPHQIHKDREFKRFYTFLQRKGWKNIVRKKKDIFGKRLRDYSASSPAKSEVGENLFLASKDEVNGEQVREVDFGVGLEDIVDYVSPEEATKEDTQVRKLLRLLGEQNNKEHIFALSYSDRPELVQLYNAGISCTQTSAALLYKVFEILTGKGQISKVLDIGGAHGAASIKAKQEFESKSKKDLEMTIADMDVTGLKIARREAENRNVNVEIRQMALPYDSYDFKPNEKYDLITATYFFCEQNPQEIKETIQQLPESKYFFATLPPSNTEKRDVLLQSLKEKGYKIRHGIFPVKLEDSSGKKFQYSVIAIGGTRS